MNKLKRIFTIFLLFCVFYILFRYNYLINKSVVDAVNLWLTKVFPSLFIMFILNDIIINTNILKPINKLINPIFNKIFTTNNSSFETFILSIFSGTPSSAFIIKEKLQNKSITEDDANKLIAFTYFSNPLFLYNILNLSFNKFITLKIILIHYLSNIIIGIFFRNKNTSKSIYNIENQNHNNLFYILPLSITKSLNTLLMILGTITFYMIITNIIITIIPMNNIYEIIFKGFIEITQSLNLIMNIQIKSIIKEIIALTIISFGGLSIHTQVLSLINDTKIKYKNFLIGRILHVLISAGTYLLFTCFIIG